MNDIVVTIIYCGIGVILMLLGIFLVDLIIPCYFPEEIKKKNIAVGYITAGVSIGVGIILRNVIMSPTGGAVESSLLEGITSTAIYFLLGIIMFIIGYFLIAKVNKQYELNKEIGEGNPAAGIMIMGLFIGLSLVISGAIL